MALKALEPGIYQLPDGRFRVIARIGDRKSGPAPKEKRFPKGTSLRELRRWRDDQRADMRRLDLRPVKGTLAGDSERYLKIMNARLAHPEDREGETRAWFQRFGDRRRESIKQEDVRQQVLDWEAEGLAPSTIKHRLSALSQLYETLDGDKAHNPTRGLKRPKEPKPKPDGRSPGHIKAILAAMEARTKKWNRGWKTLARMKVIALTGMRHSQVKRLQPDDIALDHDVPHVVVVDAGKDGAPHAKPLTPEGVDALKLFIERKAFGEFSNSSLYKSWKLACEDAGVAFFNPYKLRHSYATALRAEGMDLADVQQLLGHKSAKTTERYAAVAPHKLEQASEMLKKAWERGGSAWQASENQEKKTG